LAVITGAFLAAVYLAADARRLGDAALEQAFRLRALVTGVLAGAVALAGLPVVHHDARHIFDGLSVGYGLTAVIVSALAGLTTLVLVWRERFQLARGSAALAVAAILAGWAAAQRPDVLPGLTLHQAAASRATLIALVVAIVVGGVVLAPSLGLLFTLVLTGGLDPVAIPAAAAPTAGQARAAAAGRTRAARLAGAFLVVGVVLLTIADADIAHVLGVLALLTAGVLAFAAVGPADLSDDDSPIASRMSISSS
jgi:cytochrome d ubiquinol oxidase subunit II